MVPIDYTVFFKVCVIYETLPEGLGKSLLMDKLRVVCSTVLRVMADCACSHEKFYLGLSPLTEAVGFLCIIGGPCYDDRDILTYEENNSSPIHRPFSVPEIVSELRMYIELECKGSQYWNKYVEWICDHIHVNPENNMFIY
ncbi:ORF6 [red squirrel adenovirus 1]|uniref:ORF6 n=1 Tax=red squirrel adenovirus 1 TaxID=2773314 RepID=A0A240FBG8_9ADEN|nr:ORF6 [red squirrel adenovirus 1]ARE31898.1 ORF6 [red squirrel adenovirus 1]